MCDVWSVGSQGNGSNLFTLTARLSPSGPPTGIGGEPPALTALELHQNFPNPFTSATRIDFDLQSNADVTVEVFNVEGRRIRITGYASLPSGPNTIELIGTSFPAGVYFYHVTARGVSQTRKMVIVR